CLLVQRGGTAKVPVGILPAMRGILKFSHCDQTFRHRTPQFPLASSGVRKPIFSKPMPEFERRQHGGLLQAARRPCFRGLPDQEATKRPTSSTTNARSGPSLTLRSLDASERAPVE